VGAVTTPAGAILDSPDAVLGFFADPPLPEELLPEPEPPEEPDPRACAVVVPGTVEELPNPFSLRIGDTVPPELAPLGSRGAASLRASSSGSS